MKEAKFSLIPLEGNESASLLLEVAEDTAKVLHEEHKISVDMPQVIPTLVEVYTKALLKKVAALTEASGETTMVNMFDLFRVGFDVAEDEESEKGGNIVPAFEPLGYMKTMGKSDETQSGE